MSTPTDRQVIDAHNALDRIYQHLLFDKDVNLKALDDAVSAVHRVLPPKPQPTVADVGWDNEKHRFAVAEHPDYGEVIMLQSDLTTGRVRILLNDYGEFHMPYALPQSLTPTGKRYTLTEVQDD